MIIEEFNYRAKKFGLSVRLVVEKDAVQILKLRTNETLSKHIHKTENSLDKQIAYIKYYKEKESKKEEFYFAFTLLNDQKPSGFYRVHHIDYENRTFSVGSWIFEPETPDNISIFADILSKEFGFEQLNLDTCYFDVRRNNKSVYRYHMLFDPIFIEEDEEQNNFYYLKKESFEINKVKLLKHLL